MKVLHHSDLDGLCSAAIVLRACPDAECIEMNYGTPVPFERIEQGEGVVIVDFSLEVPEDWKRLCEITKDVVWIDHHETAIEMAKNVVFKGPLNEDYPHDGDYGISHLYGRRDTESCGAKWYYFQEDEPPYVVSLIDLWDRWVHNDDTEVLDFRNGSDVFDLNPKSELWEVMLTDDVVSDCTIRMIREAGQNIGKLREIENAKAVKRFAYPLEWEGYHCIVLHTDKAGSQLFDSVKGQYDILMPVNYDGRKFTVHIYSDVVKVNDIAVRYNGGGHPSAGGFTCDKLPWESPFTFKIAGPLTDEGMASRGPVMSRWPKEK